MEQPSTDRNETPIVEHAVRVLERRRYLDNVYLQTLADGTMTLEQFQQSQLQFHCAVETFPRPMAALVARIPDHRTRLEILHNVVEEHGDFTEEQFHTTTFRTFLERIGADASSLETMTLWSCVRAFNCVLASAVIVDELEVGVGCMGIIEYAFSDISAKIGRAVVDRGWLTEPDLVHYKLHAEIDKRHASEFFRAVVPSWHDEKRRYFVERGLELGAYTFDRLYTDLYQASLVGQD